jgi:tetratricopeptide (TPR) repeat protein
VFLECIFDPPSASRKDVRNVREGWTADVDDNSRIVVQVGGMRNELAAHLHDEIQRLSAAGDVSALDRRFDEALEHYNAAWALIPEPKTEWNASTWLLAAIGDAAFLGGYKSSALEALRFAMHCPDGIGNPFLHLRLGQVLFEQGDQDAAADELARAYMGGGAEIFDQEEPRYSAFLNTRMLGIVH